LIYPWKRKRIFRACLNETSVVDTHPKLPADLGDDNRIGQPPGVMDLPYEANIEQILDFFTDEVLPLNKLLLRLLLDRSDVEVDLQMVLDHLPRDPGHLRQLPGKHVDVHPEEGNECEFLFVSQIPCDAGGLGGIRADLAGC
jgi:hypothetical protein